MEPVKYVHSTQPLASGNVRVVLLVAAVCLLVICVQAGASAGVINDNFADRAPIIGTNAVVYGTLSKATYEAGEPAIQGVSSGQTAWWTWTAPAKGLVHLGLEATNFRPLVTVYNGASFPNLELVASNNYQICYADGVCGCHWRTRGVLAFHVVAGEQYQIAADALILTDAVLGWYPQTFTFTNLDGSVHQLTLTTFGPIFATNVPVGNLALHLEFTPAPVNDDFRNRLTLTGEYIHTQASNVGATRETGEPQIPGNPGGSSVWYTWTAPASGRVMLSTNSLPRYARPSWWDGFLGWAATTGPTCGDAIDSNPPPPFYALLNVYTGRAVNALTPVPTVASDLADGRHVVAFDARKAESYEISFDGNQGTSGDIDLYLALTRPAPNDQFSNRILMSGVVVRARGYNTAATHEPGEPLLAGSSGQSVWWSWRAPVSGLVWINLAGSDYPYPLAVLTGDAISSLSVVRSGAGALAFPAVRKQTYHILLADDAGQTGGISLALNAPIVEESLMLAQNSPRANSAVLIYRATPGDKVLLQRSNDRQPWVNAGVVFARNPTVSFVASPAPAPHGPFYRAIIDDYTAL